MDFMPGESFLLPNGDAVLVQVRLIPLGKDVAGECLYEVMPDGTIMKTLPLGPTETFQKLQDTALTVDDLGKPF